MNEDTTKTFEELEAWQAGRELRILVFREIVPLLKQQREYDLSDQIKRASRSVTHNIAEAHGRYHYLDNYHFCSQARGSLSEVLDQLIVCQDDDLIPDQLYQAGREKFNTTLRILNGYMSWLKRSAQHQPGTPKKPSSDC